MLTINHKNLKKKMQNCILSKLLLTMCGDRMLAQYSVFDTCSALARLKISLTMCVWLGMRTPSRSATALWGLRVIKYTALPRDLPGFIAWVGSYIFHFVPLPCLRIDIVCYTHFRFN